MVHHASGGGVEARWRFGSISSVSFTFVPRLRCNSITTDRRRARRAGSRSDRTREPSPPGTGQDEAAARAALATSQCRREQGALAGRVDSPALELICLKYVGGQPLEERLAVLGPEALAKTFAAVLNAISKDAATRSLSPFTKT